MEQKTYYLIMVIVTLVAAMSTSIRYSIKWGINIYDFFITMSHEIQTINTVQFPAVELRLNTIERVLFNGQDPSGITGRNGNYREDFRPHPPINGVGLRKESSSDTADNGDRSGSVGGWDPRYPKGMVHLGLGKHVKGKRDE